MPSRFALESGTVPTKLPRHSGSFGRIRSKLRRVRGTVISEIFRRRVCYTLTMSTLLAFLGVSLIVICVPGPDTALTIRNAISGHRRAGVATAAGVATGQLAWTIAASLGIAGLLLASAPAFQAVRWAGAAYLIFLGARSLWSAVHARHDRAAIPSRDDTRRPSAQLTPARAFRQGLLSNLANPKMAAFFLSLLPQFVPAGVREPVNVVAVGGHLLPDDVQLAHGLCGRHRPRASCTHARAGEKDPRCGSGVGPRRLRHPAGHRLTRRPSASLS